MMLRTVRYFKLIYIVAGILLSNEDICETVDALQIAPRVDVKDIILPQKSQKKVQRLALEDKSPTVKESSWIPRINLSEMMDRLKNRMRPQWPKFDLWKIPNYFIDYSSNLLYRKFVVTSDCDMIYT